MIVLELFAGTAIFSKVAESRGHKVLSIDNDYFSNAKIKINILELTREDIINYLGCSPSLIWASPPCTAFSVASIGKHWGGGFRAYEPKTDAAKMGIRLLEKTLQIISWFPEANFFIENPMGVMRKMSLLANIPRRSLTFCQYGERRMKPTDVWTNTGWFPRPMCKNGDSCHEEARRGSKTGTQGLKGARERGMLPIQLCKEVIEYCELVRR